MSIISRFSNCSNTFFSLNEFTEKLNFRRSTLYRILIPSWKHSRESPYFPKVEANRSLGSRVMIGQTNRQTEITTLNIYRHRYFLSCRCSVLLYALWTMGALYYFTLSEPWVLPNRLRNLSHTLPKLGLIIFFLKFFILWQSLLLKSCCQPH